SNPLSALESIIRLLYLPLGFFLFWSIWQKESDRSKLVGCLLAASIFPAFIALLQGVDLIPVQSLRQTKGLTRANGFYHDVVTTRMFLVQGLIALYFSYRMRLLDSFRFVYPAIILIFLFAGFFIYSKAFVGILAAGAVVFLLVERRIVPVILCS